MRIDLKNIATVLIDKYLIILFLIFALTVLSGLGLSNFKLDASSDALVLENDESLKTYREAEDEFGDSSFLIVTYEPSKELFSDYSINRIANLENDLKNIDGVDSVLSLLDAPIFFQPKVGLTDVADNLKDITFKDIDLDLAKEEIINNPIYKDDRVVGRATGGEYGFRLDKSIALAMVKPDLANVGEKLKVDILGKMYEATILEESPYDAENKLLRA